MCTASRGARRAALTVALLLLSMATVEAAEWRLDESAWARPRSGQVVLSMPPVAQAVRAWSDTADATLVIHYPGGEDGILWASELHDWLVSLGLPSSRLRTVAGADPGTLRLELRQDGGR